MQVIEFLIIIILIGCQFYFWREIIRRAKLIATFLPKTNIVSVFLTEENISLLETNSSANSLLNEVVETINGYLRKNKGNAADFHLIKNIVDRHLETVDEEISHLLPVPLYCGLAATMVGIICGLLSLDGPIAAEAFVDSIGHLIDSIKYAMGCSLLGLLMTTYLSSLTYRKAKAKMEKQKNQFLNFLQTQLLPHLNEDAVATLMNMQANLQEFNTNFEQNIEGFSDIMEEIHRAFDSQVELVEQMRRMDMVQMAQFNSNVLAQLQTCMSEFQKFTRYLHQMNEFVSKTTVLTDSVNEQLQRTDAIVKISDNLQTSIVRNQSVMDFLRSFLERVDENKAIVSASQNINDAVSEAMNTLKEHVNTQVEEMKSYTTKATTELEQLMGREKGLLDKLNNLDRMNDLIRSIQNMATDNKALTEGLARRIAALSQSIDNIGHGASSPRIFPTWFIWLISILMAIASLIFIFRTGFDLWEELGYKI